jgi:hypothetical protein
MKYEDFKKLNKDELIMIILKQQNHIKKLNDELYKELAEHLKYERYMEKYAKWGIALSKIDF